jgi:hypothetical protein
MRAQSTRNLTVSGFPEIEISQAGGAGRKELTLEMASFNGEYRPTGTTICGQPLRANAASRVLYLCSTRWVFSDTVTVIGECDRTEAALSPGDGWYHRLGVGVHGRDAVRCGAWICLTVGRFWRLLLSTLFDRWSTSAPMSTTKWRRANR